MAPMNLLFLSILSTNFAVQWVTAQASGDSGYDLEKGPVFYEAYYYPEKQSTENRKTVYQNKEKIAPGTVLERSFQVPLGLELPANFDTPEENLGRTPQRNYRSLSEFKEKVRLDNKAAYQSRSEFAKNLPNFAGTEVLNRIRPGDYPLRIEYPPYRQPKYNQEYNLDHIKRFPIFPNTIYIDNINPRKNFDQKPVNDFSSRENWSLNRNFEEGSNFQESFEKPINHETRSYQEFSSPTLVTNEIRRGLEMENLPIIINSPVELRTVTRDLSRDYQNAKSNEDSIMLIDERQNLEYDRLRGFPDSLKENIFEPRPQVIRYVFSAPRQNEFERLQRSNLDQSREEKSNLINGVIQKQGEAGVKGETAIASIEVSEIPRHKIRHHHGERPKRNYSRH